MKNVIASVIAGILAGALLASDSGQLRIVRKPIPDKLVVLTFDDGCASHSTIVAPILKKLDFGATFYVSNFGLFGTRKDWYLTWEQMKTMSDAGFEIGNHTHGHCERPGIGSFLEMEKQFSTNGIPRTKTVCWPMYYVNEKTLPDLAENGYLFGRGGHERPYCPEVDHPFDIPSFTIGESHTVTHFIQRVRQAAPGRVVVLTFHGVPDKEHPWVSVEPAPFGKMMEYLKLNGYTCISMRDLADYVDPAEAMKLAPMRSNVKLDKTELASEPVPMALSEILEFSVWGVNTLRKGENIELINIHGVDITSVKPSIIVSPGATIVPGSQEPVDLSTPKTFVVTASDRTTTKYTVSIQNTSPLATRAADLAGNFPSPPPSAKTGVFWFWVNGNITREGITADLEAMARVGIGRVVIFEVSGDIPGGTVKFLSDEWRALFRHALAEANRLDVKLNINNDAGWCGSGGPWNTPENSMQKLVSTRTGVEGGKPFDAVLPQPPTVKGFYRDILVLATKALPAGDDPKRIWPRSQAVDLTSRTDASGRLRWDPPAGTWDVLRIGHTSTGKDNHPAPESGCGPECDKLSKAAVKAHFDGMMAKLITDAGPLAGKTLEYTHIDSWEVGTQNWTPAFRAEFKRLRGYDPLPFLPGELGYIVDDAETQRRFQWDMRVTVSDLMLENYAGYFRELAAAHGLKLSVEAYGAHPGHCPVNNLAYAGRSDIPTGEFWVGHDAYGSCKEMASASHVYGKRLTGAEAFTAWPDNARYQFHPGNIKVMGDRSFCVGVNRLMLHCYTHQPWLDRAPGMTMQGWGTHFERTQTWWEQSKAWHTYIARCQHLLQSGLFAADVCYLDVEDAPRDAPYPIKLPGYDYDVCPAEVVKNRMSVKNGRITLPDGMSYRLLVLPPTDRMTPETLRSVVALAKAGAVIAATTVPVQSPSLQNHPRCDAEVKALATELFGELAAAPATGIRESRCGAGKVLLGGNVTHALTALGIQPDVTFTNAGKENSFRWIHRRTDTADFFFIANQLAEENQVACTFRVAGAQPELWHPETGRITTLPVYKSTADGRIEVPLKFGPTEAFFVVFRKGGQKVTVDGVRKPGRNWLEFTPAQTIDGAWNVTFDPKWGGSEKPVVFEALTDWSSNAVEGVRFYSGTAVYQKTFAVEPAVAGQPSVSLDLGQVEVMADVKLNGKDLGTLWKKPFRIDVTGHLKPGDNQLEIRVVNLWCNRLIGDQQLPEDAEWKNGFMGWGGQFQILKSWPQWLKDGKPSPGGRFTFSTASYYKKEDALKPSGLLGPVQLLMAR